MRSVGSGGRPHPRSVRIAGPSYDTSHHRLACEMKGRGAACQKGTCSLR